jgi:Rod binding domain-containing protein
MNTIRSWTVATTSIPQDSKLRRAAQEFEGELLACLLKPLEHAFSGMSGVESSTGSDQYGSIAIQNLAGALSRSGGIGMAEMVLRQIGRTKGMGESGLDPATGMRSAGVSD